MCQDTTGVNTYTFNNIAFNGRPLTIYYNESTCSSVKTYFYINSSAVADFNITGVTVSGVTISNFSTVTPGDSITGYTYQEGELDILVYTSGALDGSQGIDVTGGGEGDENCEDTGSSPHTFADYIFDGTPIEIYYHDGECEI